MARPTEDEKKFRIQMRCNKEQYEHLAYLAEIQHVSRSEVFRRMLRGVNVNAPEYIFRGHYKILQSIRNELRRQGGLIKKLYNDNPAYAQETRAAWRAYEEAIKQAEYLLKRFAERYVL